MKTGNINNSILHLLVGIASLLIGLFLTFALMPRQRERLPVGHFALSGFVPELRGELS